MLIKREYFLATTICILFLWTMYLDLQLRNSTTRCKSTYGFEIDASLGRREFDYRNWSLSPELHRLKSIKCDQGQLNERWIFVITPTSRRNTQRADLVRLLNTLAHVSNLHLILVEDSVNKTKKVSDILRSGPLSIWTHSNILSTPLLKVAHGLYCRKQWRITLALYATGKRCRTT